MKINHEAFKLNSIDSSIQHKRISTITGPTIWNQIAMCTMGPKLIRTSIDHQLKVEPLSDIPFHNCYFCKALDRRNYCDQASAAMSD